MNRLHDEPEHIDPPSPSDLEASPLDGCGMGRPRCRAGRAVRGVQAGGMLMVTSYPLRPWATTREIFEWEDYWNRVLRYENPGSIGTKADCIREAFGVSPSAYYAARREAVRLHVREALSR